MTIKKQCEKHEYFDNRKRIQEICDTTPRDVNGMPIIEAGPETFWSIMRCYRGNIPLNGKDYFVHFTCKGWRIPGVDRRKLTDDEKEIIQRLHNNFLKAYMDERVMRSGMAKKTRKILNKKYYQMNSEEVLRKRKESQKSMLAQNELQINEILELILQNKARHEIKAEMVAKYNFTERRINQLITSAHQRVKNIASDEREILKDKIYKQLQDLYNKNIEKDDLREARSILEVMNKMYALNDPVTNKIEMNQKIIKFSFDMSGADPGETKKLEYKDIPDHLLGAHNDESEDADYTDGEDNAEATKLKANNNSENTSEE